MSESFKVGQEVIFSHGDLKDIKGTIVNPYFQLSQSDWPEVIVRYAGGRIFCVDIDKVRPAEDPYEYGATWKMDGREEYYPVFSDEWGTLESAQEELEDNVKKYPDTYRDPKIIRRLKAGEPEDFDV